MTPSELRAIGQALYGERWSSPIARDLGVKYRTIRRWMVGQNPIPDSVEAELLLRLRERAQQIATLIPKP